MYFCWIELVTTLLMPTFPYIPAYFRCQAYLLDAIYCVYIPCRTYIQCTYTLLAVPAVRSAHCPCGRVALLAPLAVRAARSAVHVLRPDRFQPLAALACPRPYAWPCGLAPAPVWPRGRARSRALPCPCARACVRVRGRCPPTFQSLAVHFIRL